MRHLPKLTYKGLTVILANNSRADKVQLLSAKGGQLFHSYLAPEFNSMQCEIRTRDHKEDFLPNTKCLLLLGKDAANQYLPETADNPFGAIRGYIYNYKGIPTVCSYFPQDCADRQDYETQFNKQTTNVISDDERETKEGETEIGQKSRHGKTSRENFKFWLRRDIARCKSILTFGSDYYVRPFEPNYIIYPNSSVVVQLLSETKNEYFYIDIETDSELNMLCFSFCFSNKPQHVYVVPIISYDYTLAYSNVPAILRCLAIAFKDNTTVAHNGAAFDFFVFAYKYKLPIGRSVYDTMIAHHRCYPEVEKSLGHCMSIWCPSEPYHKDEGGSGYMNSRQAEQLYAYCGKDVFGMILLHRAITEYAKKMPGLEDSINQAMASIRPYLICTLQGIKYSQEALAETLRENDELMMQYIRMTELLVGKETIAAIKGKGKSSMLNSNKQCVRYFHELLCYTVVATSPETGLPSLGKESIFKLRLKHANPVLDLVIKYREVQKESGMLGFVPWKTDDLETVTTEQKETNQQTELSIIS